MPRSETTKPCDYCGALITKTATQQSQRTYWTCGRSCANKLRIKLGNTAAWAPNPFRGQQETRSCGICGMPVTRYLSQARTQQQWTCSRTCAATLRGRQQVAAGTWKRPQKPRRGDMFPCEVCGKEFYRLPAYIKQGRKYCSRECNAIGQTKQKVIKNCKHCGAEMRLRPSYGHMQFCSKRCESDAKIVRPTGRIHNGRPVRLNDKGYVLLWEPEHPNKSMGGWQFEHRIVMEQSVGRYLTTAEQVDHINQNKQDNQPENLQVLTPSAHSTKTNAENLGALKELRALTELLKTKQAAYEQRFGPLDG
jgi:hypothetical protein